VGSYFKFQTMLYLKILFFFFSFLIQLKKNDSFSSRLFSKYDSILFKRIIISYKPISRSNTCHFYKLILGVSCRFYRRFMFCFITKCYNVRRVIPSKNDHFHFKFLPFDSVSAFRRVILSKNFNFKNIWTILPF
jgi:hypothetical protein